MILEHAILQVKAGQQQAFEAAMRDTLPLIEATPGFIRLEVRSCIESAARYLLLVWWQRLENHTEDFRGSPRYQQWREKLHHFYEPFPLVEHYALPVITKEGKRRVLLVNKSQNAMDVQLTAASGGQMGTPLGSPSRSAYEPMPVVPSATPALSP